MLKPGHFKFEARLMIWLLVAFAGVTLLLGVAVPWFIHHLEVDKCLDAGGAYDYQREVCVGARGK